MEFEVRSDTLTLDEWLESYLRTTLAFSTWQGLGPRAQTVCVLLEREGSALHETTVRCTLHVETPDGERTSTGATGHDVYEAVDRASRLLETAMFAASHRPSAAPGARLAA